MIKSSNNGMFTIPAAPSAGTSVAQSSSANTYGSYIQMIASTAEADYIVGLRFSISASFTTTPTYLSVVIGTGGAGSETIIATVDCPIYNANVGSVTGAGTPTLGGRIDLPFPVPVATATRIACKTASDNAAANGWKIVLECYKQADLIDAGIKEQADVQTWLTNAVTNATAGIPDINVKNYNNVAAATDANNLPKVDVEDFGGAAGTFASGRPEVNTTKWLGGTIPAVNTTGVPLVDTKYVTGTLQTARDVGGNCDTTISSRLASSSYTTPPTAAAIAAAVLTDTGDSGTAGSLGAVISHVNASGYLKVDVAQWADQGVSTGAGFLPSVCVGSGLDSGGNFISGAPGVLNAGTTGGPAGNGNASATTILLGAGASATDGAYVGCLVIVDASVQGVIPRVITSYTGSTRSATVDRAWPGGLIPGSGVAQYPYYVLAADAPALNASLQTTDVHSANLDAAVSTRSTYAGGAADANIAAVKAKTDLIATNAADSPNAATAQVNAATATYQAVGGFGKWVLSLLTPSVTITPLTSQVAGLPDVDTLLTAYLNAALVNVTVNIYDALGQPVNRGGHTFSFRVYDPAGDVTKFTVVGTFSGTSGNAAVFTVPAANHTIATTWRWALWDTQNSGTTGDERMAGGQYTILDSGAAP